LKRLVWSILMVLPLGALADDIYRSVDANGVVVYSDRPSADAEAITVVASVMQTARPAAPAEDEASDEDRAVFAEVPREATPEELAAERAQNCEIARQRATAYSQSQRLFRTDADGERIYLTDDEIDEARSTAEADVAAWCD
jgi:hypothetical protein